MPDGHRTIDPAPAVLTVSEVARELRCSKAHVTSSMRAWTARGPCPLYGWAAAARAALQPRRVDQSQRNLLRSDRRQTLTPLTRERNIMRRRYQQGSLSKVDGNWIAQWWKTATGENGRWAGYPRSRRQRRETRSMRSWPLSTAALRPPPLPPHGVNS